MYQEYRVVKKRGNKVPFSRNTLRDCMVFLNGVLQTVKLDYNWERDSLIFSSKLTPGQVITFVW